MEGVGPEAKIGAITLGVLGLAVAFMVVFEDAHFRPGVRFHITMARTGSLKEKAPVRIAGLTLGRIERIGLAATQPDAEEPTSAILEVWIERRHAWLVREDSVFFVNQQGILGEAYLEVGAVPGQPPGRPLEDGATVAGIAPPRLDRVLANSYRNLEAATALIRDGMPEVKALGHELDALDANLATVSPSPGAALAAWSSLRALAREADAMADGLEGVNLAATRARAGSFQTQLESTRGQLVPRLRALSASLDRLAALRLGNLARVVDDARALYGRAQQTLAAAAVLLTYVSDGKGTLGAILNDAELNDDLKAMSKRLKRTPWEAAGHPSMKK